MLTGTRVEYGGIVAPSMRSRATLGIIGILFLAAADVTVVSTLLPAISASIGGQALFPWLMSIFMATMALSGMCAGALADRYGIRQVLSLAVITFLAASAMAGFAPSMKTLLAARAVQGIGAGMIIVLSYSSLVYLCGMAQSTKVQTLIGITWGVAAVLGPSLGMLVADKFGWRFVFAVNVPVGVICLKVFRDCVPAFKASDRRPLDWPAQLAFASLIFALMLGISAKSLQLDGRAICSLLAFGVSAFVILWLRIRRDIGFAPLPLAFFNTRSLAILTFIVPSASMGLYASVTFLPMAMAHGTAAGMMPVVIIAAAVSFVLTSSLCGLLVQWLGYGPTMAIGTLCLLAGSLLLSGGTSGSSVAVIALAEGMIGAGMGCVAVAAVLFAQCAAPEGYLSTYTSAVQVLRNIGAAVGINLFAAMQTLAAAHITNLPPERFAFLMLAILFSLCTVLAYLLPRSVLQTPSPIT